METFRSSYLNEHGVELNFVQDNQSQSRIGTLRGLHYQLKFPQGKLVRVISGTVFDVAVDIRKIQALSVSGLAKLCQPKTKAALGASGVCAWVFGFK